MYLINGKYSHACIKHKSGEAVSAKKYKEMTDSHAKAWELYYQAQDKLTLAVEALKRIRDLSQITGASFEWQSFEATKDAQSALADIEKGQP